MGMLLYTWNGVKLNIPPRRINVADNKNKVLTVVLSNKERFQFVGEEAVDANFTIMEALVDEKAVVELLWGDVYVLIPTDHIVCTRRTWRGY